jgi:hypothetical protein
MSLVLVALGLGGAACYPAVAEEETPVDLESMELLPTTTDESQGEGGAGSAEEEDDLFGPGTQRSVKHKFDTQLLPQYEEPPIFPKRNDPESLTFGVGRLTLKVKEKHDGDIKKVKATLQFQICGFLTPTFTITGAHIHKGFVDENGPIVITTDVSPTDPLTLPVDDGCIRASLEGSADPNQDLKLKEIAEKIIKRPVGFYMNVHSQRHPGGFARGQLAPKIDPKFKSHHR